MMIVWPSAIKPSTSRREYIWLLFMVGDGVGMIKTGVPSIGIMA